MRKLLIAVVMAVCGVIAVAVAPSANAVDLFNNCSSSDPSQCALVKQNTLNYKGNNSVWAIVQFILGALGGVAVIMIVIGGIKYATSGGDPAGVTSAKNTILYAVIGLVVALAASGIVLLVSNYFG